MRQDSAGVTLYKMEFRENVPLAPYTTFRIGGPARWFAQASNEVEILEAVSFAHQHKLPLFVLGGGSNLLVSDAGFPGLVLRIGLMGITQIGDDTFIAAAGEDWDPFVTRTVEANCGGIECLAGIPGSVGGTPVQNVGAYGQEVSQTIVEVRALDLHSAKFLNLSGAACDFSYRGSIFNGSARGQYIVTRVTYKLLSGTIAETCYADLKRYFNEWIGSPSVADVASAVRDIRQRKGMLLIEGDPDCVSAGSFFKNPIVSREVLARVQESSADPVVPHFNVSPEKVKMPAAWLLEQSGFHRGYTLGRAGISSRHTLAIINRGGACASEILALRDRIVAVVKQRFGISLESEPVHVR